MVTAIIRRTISVRSGLSTISPQAARQCFVIRQTLDIVIPGAYFRGGDFNVGLIERTARYVV